MTDPAAIPTEVLFVGTTEWDAGGDQTCVIEPGRFSGITKRSMVRYRLSEITTTALLDQALIAGLIRLWKDTVQPPLLDEVTRGFGRSPFAKADAIALLKRHGLLK